jgi:hypothetical protein
VEVRQFFARARARAARSAAQDRITPRTLDLVQSSGYIGQANVGTANQLMIDVLGSG